MTSPFGSFPFDPRLQLDGSMCVQCGASIDGEPPGSPRVCVGCEEDFKAEQMAGMIYDDKKEKANERHE